MAKLEEKEFNEITELNQKFQNAKMSLGDLEITKQSILSQIDGMKVQFSQLEKQLIDKYGADSVIDMKTGQIKSKDE
jgi:hypothetical protein|tara:strand:- start:881 stop:1111 length:231 start_codon:yes stop_codon:yes gene_type:complete